MRSISFRLIALPTLLILLASCHQATDRTGTLPATQSGSLSMIADSSPQASSGIASSSSVSASGMLLTSLTHEPVSFTTKGMDVIIEKHEEPFPQEEIQYRIDNAKACGPERPARYFQKLQKTFEGTMMTVYRVIDRQYPEAVYTIMVIPNKTPYKDTAAFKEDFFVCGMGGDFPRTAGRDWLVFTEGCGDMSKPEEVNRRCDTYERVLERSITAK